MVVEVTQVCRLVTSSNRLRAAGFTSLFLFCGAEGHGYVGFVGFLYLEHWARRQIHEAGYKGVGHLLNADVEGVY